MGLDQRQEDRIHELRLEGVGLLIGGGVLIALLAGTFLLGRWVERQDGPVRAAGPLDYVTTEEPPADASRGLTVFDGAADGRRSLEPRREAAPAADPGAAPPARPQTPPKVGEGPYWVQVFAGRDQAGAKDLVAALERSGWGVRVSSEREGRDTLFRVRVGGYPTEGQAAAAASRLKVAGYPGAFVARAD